MRTVTGTIKHADNSVWASGQIEFTLLAPIVAGDVVYPVEKHTETADGSGAFTTALAVPDTGTAHYRIATPDGNTYTLYLADGPTIDLSDLLTIATSEISQSAAQTLLDTHSVETDPHPEMLSGDAFEYAVDVRIDTGTHWLPFGTFQDVAPFTAQAYPYIAAIDRSLTVTGMKLAALVATTNDASNYWQIQVITIGSQEVIGVDTSAIAADVWTLLTAPEVSIASLTTATKAVYVACDPVGSPGALNISVPMMTVQTHDANP